MVYVDAFRPSIKRHAALFDLGLILGGSLFIALSAQIVFRLPFSPVPITGQTLSVLLVGALLGSRRGMLSLLAYLAEGAAGLPVFSGGGAGLIWFLGPTGGYLLAFVPAAFVTGWLAERGWDRRVATTMLLMLAGNVVIYVGGLSWLGLQVGFDRALPLGLYPFIVGDVAKSLLATALLPSAWRLLHRQ